jgi:hypothetical protein
VIRKAYVKVNYGFFVVFIYFSIHFPYILRGALIWLLNKRGMALRAIDQKGFVVFNLLFYTLFWTFAQRFWAFRVFCSIFGICYSTTIYIYNN